MGQKGQFHETYPKRGNSAIMKCTAHPPNKRPKYFICILSTCKEQKMPMTCYLPQTDKLCIEINLITKKG